MNRRALALEEAARQLQRHPSTLRRWIAAGAPCVEPGAVGRGHGALVDIVAMQRWRARDLAPSLAQRADAEILALIAVSFEDAIKRDRVHQRVQISEGAASGLFALLFERCFVNFTQRPRGEMVLPPEIKQLCAIWLQSRERNLEHHWRRS